MAAPQRMADGADWRRGAAPMSAGARPVRAPRGGEISCRSWQTEAVLRCLMNNLDPEVAEDPDNLVVYGGTGRAARSWECFDAIVATPTGLPLCTSSVSSSPRSRSVATMASKHSQLRAARPLPP